MKTKMRKYEAGGDVVDETGMSFGTIKRNTETGELYDTEDSFKPVPKSMPVTETKAKTESKKEPKKETKAESKKESKPASNKPDSVNSGGKEGREKTGFELKKEAALARSDAEPSATKAETSETRSLSAPKNREKTGFELKKEKFMNKGMRAGGSVSSASKRADGIAQRGKTRA